MSFVTALPADPQNQDPLDPERILQELPDSRARELPQPISGSAGWRPGSGPGGSTCGASCGCGAGWQSRPASPATTRPESRLLPEQARGCSWRSTSGCGAARDLPAASGAARSAPDARPAWRRVRPARPDAAPGSAMTRTTGCSACQPGKTRVSVWPSSTTPGSSSSPWTMTPDWFASTVWCGSADPDAGPAGLCPQNHV